MVLENSLWLAGFPNVLFLKSLSSYMKSLEPVVQEFGVQCHPHKNAPQLCFSFVLRSGVVVVILNESLRSVMENK